MAGQLTKRHPIRGFIWGIFFGLGLAMIAIGQGYAALGTWPPLILLIVGIVLGTVWGLFAPAKKPKGDPPREPVQVDAGSSRVAAEIDDRVDTADETSGGETSGGETSGGEIGAADRDMGGRAPTGGRELSLGELAGEVSDGQDPPDAPSDQP